MPIEITMPALSPTMEEGNLAKWHVKEGDNVSSGDVIAEIETDKATMEVEAVEEGTVARILIAEGTEAVKVNTVIAVLAEEGEDVSAAAAEQPKQAETEPAEAPAPASTPALAAMPASSATENSASVSKGDRIFASPLARRIASQKGINLSTVTGSGPRGRIIKSDVENLSGGQPEPTQASVETPAAAAPAPVSAMPDTQVLAFYKEGDYELLPHDNMRKTIAARLTESSQTIPAYFLSMDCTLDAMLALRKQINDAAPAGEDEKPAYKVSVNDFIIKAMALALRDVPMANASWTSSARVLHKHADVGVAVAIPDGLITPIVREAENKTLSAISNEMKDLAKRARDKKLKPEEYQGGSTAVSNLGMFGFQISRQSSILRTPQSFQLAPVNKKQL